MLLLLWMMVFDMVWIGHGLCCCCRRRWLCCCIVILSGTTNISITVIIIVIPIIMIIITVRTGRCEELAFKRLEILFIMQS